MNTPYDMTAADARAADLETATELGREQERARVLKILEPCQELLDRVPTAIGIVKPAGLGLMLKAIRDGNHADGPKT